MNTLGMGIVGCGWVAEEYIKAAQCDGRVEVRALVSRTPGKPDSYRQRYNLDATIGNDYEQLMQRDDIDIVVVSTPHDLHTGPVVAAAEAGKHVIIEKPVALTMDNVRKQQAAVQKTGVKTIVSFVLTWNPLLISIDALIRDGALGNVFLVEVDYLHRIWCGSEKWLGVKDKAGSSFLAGGCHAVSAMQWFARSEAVEVCAYSVQTENPNDYPGTTTAIVKFADGTLGRTTSCFDAQMPYVFHIGVYGTEGSVRNDKVFIPKIVPGQNAFMTVPSVLPDSGDVAHHPFQGEVSHFVDCILEDKKPFPNLDDAAKTMAICIAADISSVEGRPVKISEV
ncbi:MAG: Gfo/Idh/MocA family protein [Candidatus Hydrogenedentales bacterium]|jgi:predicted dehydrogenase